MIFIGVARDWFDAVGKALAEGGAGGSSEQGEVLVRGVGTPRYSFSTRCICAVAAWRFDNLHPKVVPRSRIPRSTSHVS